MSTATGAGYPHPVLRPVVLCTHYGREPARLEGKDVCTVAAAEIAAAARGGATVSKNVADNRL